MLARFFEQQMRLKFFFIIIIILTKRVHCETIKMLKIKLSTRQQFIYHIGMNYEFVIPISCTFTMIFFR